MVNIIDNTLSVPYERGDFLDIDGLIHQVVQLNIDGGKDYPKGLYTVNLENGIVGCISSCNPPTDSVFDIRKINVRDVELT